MEDITCTDLRSCWNICPCCNIEGWVRTPVNYFERLTLAFAAILLIYPGYLTDLVGFSLIATIVILNIKHGGPKASVDIVDIDKVEIVLGEAEDKGL